jgi:hypothetical protein
LSTSSSSSSPLDNVENVGEEILNDNRESEPVLELSLEEPALEAEETSQQSVHRSTRIRTFPRKYDEFVMDVTSNSGNNFQSSFDFELNFLLLMNLLPFKKQ